MTLYIYSRDDARYAQNRPMALPSRLDLPDGGIRTRPYAPEDIAAAGFVPAPDQPAYDPISEQVIWTETGWAVESLPDQPAMSAKTLTRVEFVRLCMSAGGMTPDMLVQAKLEPQLAAMWIMLEMAQQVRRDDPEIPPGLAALEGVGYLPNGASAVLEQWPLG